MGKETNVLEKQKQANNKKRNEVGFPEVDCNPFIIFKNRRIKKKFKAYIKKSKFLIAPPRGVDDEIDFCSENVNMYLSSNKATVVLSWRAPKVLSSYLKIKT